MTRIFIKEYPEILQLKIKGRDNLSNLQIQITESLEFGGYCYVLHSGLMYSGRGESGHWRLIVKNSDSFVIFDDDKIPYGGSMVDLKKYATDLIFMKKNKVSVVESSSKNYKIFENGNHDQPRMVQISFLKRKNIHPEMAGPKKFPRLNENDTETMASASTEIINGGSIGITDSTRPTLVKGAKLLTLSQLTEIIEKSGRVIEIKGIETDLEGVTSNLSGPWIYRSKMKSYIHYIENGGDKKLRLDSLLSRGFPEMKKRFM